ncbi:MAG: aspartate ammonia-lyase [Prevotellaceae bacterium]|jgi:aspartate ammonia-lyase|nr:aspartate ammonia-lyase [Prevotellaceae bacterium]
MLKVKFPVSGKTRMEHDLLGDRSVPEEALFGIQTLRGIENFTISRARLYHFHHFIKGLAIVKMGAVLANNELGLITDQMKDAIVQACQDLIDGKYHNHFPVDMIQGGAGTSTNMNANEVIANRALEILGKKHGEYEFCHPNNHVNMSQSTNDAYPSAVHFAIYYTHLDLVKSLEALLNSLEKKAEEFAGVIKMGRTQLQDAVPMTLGQSFAAFASALKSELKNLHHVAQDFLTVNMGATAIGTGICSEPGYSEACIRHLREITNLDIVLAPDLVEATSDTTPMMAYSSAMKRLAIKIGKICNDLRLMSSGPRAGLGEINLPPKQPGSSIMPGKVNPVIPEVMNQICFRVIGNDLTCTMAAEAAQLELNVMEPVMVYCLFESAHWLKNGFNTLRIECVDGITANADHCRALVENSIGLVTALNPYIGYQNSTTVAKEALESGHSVYELVLEKKMLTKEQLDKILDHDNMIKPVKLDL